MEVKGGDGCGDGRGKGRAGWEMNEGGRRKGGREGKRAEGEQEAVWLETKETKDGRKEKGNSSKGKEI